MKPHTTISTLICSGLSALLVSCSGLEPGSEPREVFNKSNWTHAPSWANSTLRQDWWRDYGSSALNRDIEVALAQNPGLAAMAARLEQASAVESQARAASYPKINLGFGAQEGRSREPDFGPYDLQPFTTYANLSWEIDLTGKLRAATRSASEAKNAAFWDLHAAKLHLATKVAESHFRTSRISKELDLMQKANLSHQKTLAILQARMRAGLISETEVQRHHARQGFFDRALLDLQRLHGQTLLQLATLKGQTSASTKTSSALPEIPRTLPNSTTTGVLRQRPDLLAAEARVRSAFQIEESTRLNLLPSFGLKASAMGGTNSLTNRFNVWEAKVGPTLDIPLYDPTRLAALKSKRAQTKAVAADYRAVVLKAFEETESAYLNFQNHRQQLQRAQAEVHTLQSAHQNIRASQQAGVISDLELLDSERQVLESQKVELALQQSLLIDHLALIRALGGGLSAK